MNRLLVILFLNELELICLRTIKWFQVTLIILFNINHLFAHSEVVSGIANINTFICYTVKWFQVIPVIQFKISDLFALS